MRGCFIVLSHTSGAVLLLGFREDIRQHIEEKVTALVEQERQELVRLLVSAELELRAREATRKVLGGETIKNARMRCFCG